MAARHPILTIGHSSHPLPRFLDLLRGARVMAVADVRSAPVSRFVPHFNKDRLATALARSGIAYVFLGEELGGCPEQPELFSDGVADYEKMAKLPSFQAGIQRLVRGAQEKRIVVMCAEADPLDCHRCLLVGRALAELGIEVAHILSSGEIAPQGEIEGRLLGLAGLGEADLLLRDSGERLAEAYRARGRKVAYAARKAPISGGAARRD
ncbi:MAG: DUF488 family protein [Actinomycetota bacterium]